MDTSEEKEILRELYEHIVENKHTKVKTDNNLITFKGFLESTFEK